MSDLVEAKDLRVKDLRNIVSRVADGNTEALEPIRCLFQDSPLPHKARIDAACKLEKLLKGLDPYEDRARSIESAMYSLLPVRWHFLGAKSGGFESQTVPLVPFLGRNVTLCVRTTPFWLAMPEEHLQRDATAGSHDYVTASFEQLHACIAAAYSDRDDYAAASRLWYRLRDLFDERKPVSERRIITATSLSDSNKKHCTQTNFPLRNPSAAFPQHCTEFSTLHTSFADYALSLTRNPPTPHLSRFLFSLEETKQLYLALTGRKGHSLIGEHTTHPKDNLLSLCIDQESYQDTRRSLMLSADAKPGIAIAVRPFRPEEAYDLLQKRSFEPDFT